jgi:hypothetical protein
VKSGLATGWTSDVIYGVPLGTHTITIVGGYPPDGKTMPTSVTVSIQQ